MTQNTPFLEHSSSQVNYQWKPQTERERDSLLPSQQKPGFFSILRNTWQMLQNVWTLVQRVETENMPPHQYRELSYASTLPIKLVVSTCSSLNNEIQVFPRYGNGMNGSRGWDNFDVMAGKENLMTAKADQYEKLRRIIHPYLQSHSVHKNFAVMKLQTTETINLLCQKGEFRIKEQMMRHACCLFSRTYLGIELIECDKILQALSILMEIHFQLVHAYPTAMACKFFRTYFGSCAKYLDLDEYYKAHAILDNFIHDILKEPFELVQTMNDALTKQESVDNFKMLFFAGTETTASLLSTVVYLLAINKSLQEILLQELKEAHVHSITEIEFEDLNIKSKSPQFLHLKCLVLEALRLVPPLPAQVRGFNEKKIINGVCFEAGASVIMDHAAHNRDERNYRNPDEFYPDRFIKAGKLDQDLASDTLQAFGKNKSLCPGQSLALTEVQLFVIELLLKTDFFAEDKGLRIEKRSSAYIDPKLTLHMGNKN